MTHAFICQSPALRQIVKSITLSSKLPISILIYGQRYTGKKSLLDHIFQGLVRVDASDHLFFERAIESESALVVHNLEKLTKPTLLETASAKGIKLLATYNSDNRPDHIASLFGFIYHMPPLCDRNEDTKALQELFIKEVCSLLGINRAEIDLDELQVDLSQNIRSLKQGIYKKLFARCADKAFIQESLFWYLLERLVGKNGYKDHIGLFEVPLIQAGLKRYGSQLKLSEALGINRNTLRKKIHEHKIDQL